MLLHAKISYTIGSNKVLFSYSLWSSIYCFQRNYGIKEIYYVFEVLAWAW